MTPLPASSGDSGLMSPVQPKTLVPAPDLTNGTSRGVMRPNVPCECVYAGQRFQLGSEICLNGRRATCGMVLNNTSWQVSRTPCPTS